VLAILREIQAEITGGGGQARHDQAARHRHNGEEVRALNGDSSG